MKNICVIGVGYVGLISAVCFAEKGNNVICIDKNEEKIDMLNKGIMPIYEIGLEELCNKNKKNGTIEFTTNMKYGIENSEMIFITVSTPPLENGNVDISKIENVSRLIARYINGYKIIAIKSTVPVGTNKYVKDIINKYQENKGNFDVVSNPEFLKEGTAIYDTFNADRIVIGSDNKYAMNEMKVLYSNFNQPIFETDIESSEMIKYASNSFLATKISFINEIANICEKVGANINDVANGMGMDRRILRSFLNPGIGYGGSCLPKDTCALVAMAHNCGYNAELIKSVISINKKQRIRLIIKLQNLLGDIKNKTIGVLGLAFKPGTDDMREAPSIDIINEIQRLGGVVKAYDCMAMNNAKKILSGVIYTESAYEAVEDVDAILILTEWEEFKELDINKIKALSKQNVIIDGRNIFRPNYIISRGFLYDFIGNSERDHKLNQNAAYEEVAISEFNE